MFVCTLITPISILNPIRMITNLEEASSHVSIKPLDLTRHTRVVTLLDTEIHDIVCLVAAEGMSREESVCVLANMGLMMQRTLKGGAGSCWARLPPTVVIAPSLLEMQPSVLEVEGVARQITKRKLSVSELYYRLAQRLYLLHIIGGARLGPKPFTGLIYSPGQGE